MRMSPIGGANSLEASVHVVGSCTPMDVNVHKSRRNVASRKRHRGGNILVGNFYLRSSKTNITLVDG